MNKKIRFVFVCGMECDESMKVDGGTKNDSNNVFVTHERERDRGGRKSASENDCENEQECERDKKKRERI